MSGMTFMSAPISGKTYLLGIKYFLVLKKDSQSKEKKTLIWPPIRLQIILFGWVLHKDSKYVLRFRLQP